MADDRDSDDSGTVGGEREGSEPEASEPGGAEREGAEAGLDGGRPEGASPGLAVPEGPAWVPLPLARMAAEGDATARLAMASLAFAGRGEEVPPDLALARRWAVFAARAGSSDGAWNAGVMSAGGLGTERDSLRAEGLLRLASMLGDEKAQEALSRLLPEGPSGEPRPKALVPIWRCAPGPPPDPELARRAPLALSLLGALGEDGETVERDPAAGERSLADLAAAGHPRLWLFLAALGERQGDRAKALACALQAAHSGVPEGCRELGALHDRLGEPAEAARWYQRGLEAGDGVCARLMGLLAEKAQSGEGEGGGEGGGQDPGKAFGAPAGWYLMALRLGDRHAWSCLIRLQERLGPEVIDRELERGAPPVGAPPVGAPPVGAPPGESPPGGSPEWAGLVDEAGAALSEGADPDFEAGRRLFLLAAERGHPPSMYKLGVMSERGDGVDKDLAEAARWWIEAADQGDPRARHRLVALATSPALCGEGAAPVRRLAGEWLRSRLEVGDSDLMALLADVISEDLGEGQGDQFAEARLAEARHWRSEASKLGHLGATHALASMTAEGQGGPADLRAAIALWRRAAEAGYPPAQTRLGLMSETGDGVPWSLGEAARWYRLAADQGQPEACFRLGLLSLEGPEGLDCDEEAALELWRRAAEGGHEEARAVMEYLAQERERDQER
jgi:TPR repeat protein